MNENKAKQEVKTPISVILDMAKNEVENFVLRCMQANNIPPSLMTYVVKDVLLEMMQMKVEQLSEEFVESHKSEEIKQDIDEKSIAEALAQ